MVVNTPYPVLTEMSILNHQVEYHYPVSANEPIVHPLIRKGFVFVPSAGMRLAPEILVLELYREVFFKNHHGSTGGKELDPEELKENSTNLYTTEERAVLNALRGRRRKSRNSKTQSFYAPIYPSLAVNGWLGKNRERVIVNFLLGGPIAQHLWRRGETEEMHRERKVLVDTLLRALVGHNSIEENDPHGKDILSVTLCETSFEIDWHVAENKLQDKTTPIAAMKIQDDCLSERIYTDLLVICNLEKSLPRMQWLQVLMTFLRFSMPMWLLAQLQITSLLHAYLLAVIDKGNIANSHRIETDIRNRNFGLLYPSLTPTRAIFEKTEQYMKKRIETNILLYLLEKVKPDMISNKRLELHRAGSDVLSMEELLQVTKDSIGDLKSSRWTQQEGVEDGFQNILTRLSERHAAWRDPLNKGQGKNIDEFFRVLYRDNMGDEVGGYLLLPEGRGRTRGFRVFPGQLLLKTISFLASQDKLSSGTVKGGGQLVLEDVENHFKQYGIDFSYAADARPVLVRRLQEMGLLTGSPDAGSSVAVASPY